MSAIVVTALMWGAATLAHVAPSLDRNNRYMKVELMGDRIRFAYTIFWGQQPGAQTRQRIDRNHNGKLERSETEPFKNHIAQSVSDALKVVVDGHPQRVQWARAHMGLNTPDTNGGAFSLDLLAWLCLDAPRSRKSHELLLYDSYRLPSPGENELRVHDAPGITITRSTIGARKTSLLDFRWQGGAAVLAKEGYRLDFTVNPAEAIIGIDDTCKKRQRKIAAASTAAPKHAGSGFGLWLVLAVCAGALAVAGVFVAVRRR